MNAKGEKRAFLSCLVLSCLVLSSQFPSETRCLAKTGSNNVRTTHKQGGGIFTFSRFHVFTCSRFHAGFNATKIVAADGDESVIDFMEKDPVLQENVDIVGETFPDKTISWDDAAAPR